MGKLPVVSGRQALKAFERAGWKLAGQHGSHMILTKNGVSANLRARARELDRGTLRSLIGIANMTTDEFIAFLKK